MPPSKHYSSCEVNHYELSTRLLSLTENNSSYIHTQINGQRIYKKAAGAWHGPEPSRSCEVFIGRIPHDCFEDSLVPLFSQAGELFEFRLMINFSGWNRGYAFAMFTTEAAASNAIRLFNNYEIRKSWQLGVCQSINNCRIFISRIPNTTSSLEIVQLVYKITEEVKEVRIRRGPAASAAIVEYKSHRGAAMARKALVSAAADAWGTGARPSVDWSLPESKQLFMQYREIAYWRPEQGLVLVQVPEEAPALPSAPSFSLEPSSLARRQRMIDEAHRNARLATEWSKRPINNVCTPTDMNSVVSTSFKSLPSLSGSLNARELAVWAPAESTTPLASEFKPWTSSSYQEPSCSQGPNSTSSNLDFLMSRISGVLERSQRGLRESATPSPSPSNRGSTSDFNPWTTPHPLLEFNVPATTNTSWRHLQTETLGQ